MPLSERELVCLADKYCAGDRLVPLERRYEEKMRHFADDKAVQAAIGRPKTRNGKRRRKRH